VEDRLRTAETSIEVLKNKSKVSERRISDLERLHEKTFEKLDTLQATLNRGVGMVMITAFIVPTLLTITIQTWFR